MYRVNSQTIFLAAGGVDTMTSKDRMVLSDRLVGFNVTWARGYKTFFMLNSTEHELFTAHKCSNVNNCWHFTIYEREK